MKQLLTLAAVLLLALTTPQTLQAQDFYVITNGNNILAHTNATTIGNVTGNNFNINTCLWTIDGNKIATVTPEGTTGYQIYWTNNNQPLTLRETGDDYNNVSDGQNPYNTYNSNRYYIVYNNGWKISSTNSNNGTMHRVTVTTTTTTGSTPTSESYTAAISGNTAIYTTGAHNFSHTISHLATYPTTITKTFSVSINGTNRSGSTTENGTTTTTETYTGALTNVAWSVSPTTYGTIDAATGVLTVTSLPADVATLTVTFSAQAAGQTVTATRTVMLAKDAATVEERVGGTTGVTASTVTLNDYEPHEWAYYNEEYNSPIRSWNPANVKISYYGNGINTVNTTTNSTTPGTTTWNTNATTVRVGILSGETQHTFVYYKTLERTDGTTAASPSGRCEYRTIANPFSVRPTFSSSGTKYYTGFYRWRLKTCNGGNVYTAATGGTALTAGTSTVDAEQVLYFAPTSEYGMTVEFEALWARAYIGGSTHVTGTNAYERNFYIGAPGGTALSYAATISAVYPDGTDGTDALTAVPTGTTQTNNYTCDADTKFEYIQMGAGITLTANNHYLALGRGCGTTNNVMTRIRGMNAGTNTNLNYTLRIESGKMNFIAFADGNWSGDTPAATNYSGTSNRIRSIIGNDLDRASNTITNLDIKKDVEFGVNQRFGSAKNNHILDVTVKSGSICSDGFSNPGDGGDRRIYMGISSNVNNGYLNVGLRKLTIEGGKMCNIAGGVDDGNTTDTAFALRIYGGEITGAVYGAAAFAATNGHRRYVITGGSIRGWLAGGCNGTTSTSTSVSGTVSGSTFMYIGGKAVIGYNDGTAAPHINSSDGGIIFGAGSGNELVNTGTNTERTRYRTVGQVDNSTIVLADESYVQTHVFGGGNFGYVNSTGSSIYVMGGTVGGKIFGGANQRTGKQVDIIMTGGTVLGGVYGGSNMVGDVAGPVKVSILGGTVGASGQDDDLGNVFGSGYGVGTSVTGNVHVIVGDSTSLTAHTAQPFIWGHVFGGGHEANYNATGKEFKVLGYNGTVNKNIFGGGKGVLGEAKGVITGDTYVQLRGHIHINGNVFGGGMAGNVTGDTHVYLKD